jgi:uncharacterized protein (TIGR02118 family)
VVKALALWSRPADVNAFEKDYRERHVPFARAAGVPGLRALNTLRASDDDAPYYRVAELEFDDPSALEAALASPEMAAVLADGQRVESEHGVEITLLVVQHDGDN